MYVCFPSSEAIKARLYSGVQMLRVIKYYKGPEYRKEVNTPNKATDLFLTAYWHLYCPFGTGTIFTAVCVKRLHLLCARLLL